MHERSTMVDRTQALQRSRRATLQSTKSMWSSSRRLALAATKEGGDSKKNNSLLRDSVVDRRAQMQLEKNDCRRGTFQVTKDMWSCSRSLSLAAAIEPVPAFASKPMSRRGLFTQTRNVWSSSRSLFQNATADLNSDTSESSLDEDGRKRVRFNMVRGERIIPNRQSITKEEKQLTWYNKADGEKMKTHTGYTAFRASAKRPHLVEGIAQTYKNARYLAATNEGAQIETLLNDSDAIAHHAKDLIEWTCAFSKDSYRGVEDWISEELRYSRRDDSSESRPFVVQMNKIERKWETDDYDEEKTAREYAQMGRTSRILARLFAEADAEAALRIHNGEDSSESTVNDGEAELPNDSEHTVDRLEL